MGRTKVRLGDLSPTTVASAAPPSVVSVPDPISGVVALMQVAQRQADTVVGQVRFDAERTVERERAFAQRELDRQQKLFEYIDRLKTEQRAAPPATDQMERVLIALTKRLDTQEESEDADTEEEDDGSAALQVARGLAAHIGPGLNNLLQIIAPSLKELIGAAAVKLLSSASPPAAVAPVAASKR